MNNENEVIEENSTAKFGARVYPLANGKALVKQTIKSGPNTNDDYVIDGQKEAHVNLSDDAKVAEAIRKALAGHLLP